MTFKAVYTAVATATDGRNGHAETADGKVKVALSLPKEMGGSGEGTNPEQLFALTWGACFGGALGVVAEQAGRTLTDIQVTPHVTIGKGEHGLTLEAELHVKLPGVDHAEAEKLVEAAHKICPYSIATRGNVPTKLVVEIG